MQCLEKKARAYVKQMTSGLFMLLSVLILYDTILYRLYIGDMFLIYLDALRVCLQGH